MKQLNCSYNSINTLDVSKNTELKILACSDNNLTKLDVSKNTKLEYLECQYNKLVTLDISKNTELTELGCMNNKLMILDFSSNPKIHNISCWMNNIKGDNMEALIASLPMGTQEKYHVIYLLEEKEEEGNVCTKAKVAYANSKFWRVYHKIDNIHTYYEGSDPVPSVWGDVNGDGNVNSADVQKVYSIMAGQ